MRVKTLQDRCVAKEGQYKEVVCTLNNELKEVRGKLEEADYQKEKLQHEVMALREKVETAGTNTVQKFKASQSFINSCANYYGTGFDDCLKQVASVFPELDLSRITMDDEGDGFPASNLPPKDNSVIVLAQPATNPLHTPASNPPTVFVVVENPKSQKDDENTTDAPTTFFFFFTYFANNCLSAPLVFRLLFVDSLFCYMASYSRHFLLFN